MFVAEREIVDYPESQVQRVQVEWVEVISPFRLKRVRGRDFSRLALSGFPQATN